MELRVPAGEFVSIGFGPSGCGKSTLLRMAAGLDTATSGRVEVDRSNIGYVFQDANLLPWRTVRSNVELFLELRNVPKAERPARVERALATVGLTDFADHLPARAVRRHADAGVAGPVADARAARCSCSTSRSARSTRSPASA